jgi:phosphomannomutase / phosphoglucomutase
VKEKGLDAGVGFDGDADRLGAVDETTRVIWGDQLMVLFARDVLREKPGATIIADVKCSENFFADVRKHGGKALMWKTGHANIKNKLWEEHSPLAGEMSGHFFFADRYFGYDDGIYAACRLLEIASRLRHPLSAELADLPKTFSTPEIRVDCPDDVKFKLVDKVKAKFKQKGYETIDLDGVRVKFEDGWGLVRASNTQPTLVLRFEANSADGLKHIETEFRELLANEGFTLNTVAAVH